MTPPPKFPTPGSDALVRFFRKRGFTKVRQKMSPFLLREDGAMKIFALFYIAAMSAAVSVAFAEEKVPREPDISAAWCEKNGGISEFRLHDKSRMDCYAPELGYAVEFDWAHKNSPYTCIGQARYYAAETGLNPMCILIRRPNQTHKDFRKHTRKALIGGGATIRCITANGEKIDCLTGEK